MAITNAQIQSGIGNEGSGAPTVHEIFTKINNAKDTEKELIENNFNQTIVISDQCKVAAKRTLDTFDFFEPEVTNNVTEEELNIDWGE